MRVRRSPVEIYFEEVLRGQLPRGFESFRQASDQIQKTEISLGFLEANLLKTLVSIHEKPKWVEIGTLTGFSGFCLAQALPAQGRLWTFEKDPAVADKARALFSQTGFAEKVTVVQGDAEVTLASIEGQGPFDGIFIDGNKGAYLDYLNWAEKKLAKGALVIADNVFLGGSLWEPDQEGPWSASVISRMKEFVQRLFDPNRYDACIVPTGEGLLVAKKKF